MTLNVSRLDLCTKGGQIVHIMHRPRRRHLRFEIVDHELLRRELQYAIRRRHGGSQKRAAAAIGVSQPNLNRLINGRIRWVNWTTFSALRRLVPAARREELLRAILTPRAKAALTRHQAWLATQQDRLTGVAQVGEAPHSETQTPRELEGEGRIIEAAEIYGDVVEWAAYHAEERQLLDYLRMKYPKPFADFDKFLHRHRHFDDRARLAFSQVVAPLLQYESSGGVERDWSEIEAQGKLELYLKRAFACQKILLARSPDVQRAQEIAEENMQTRARRVRDRIHSGVLDPRAWIRVPRVPHS